MSATSPIDPKSRGSDAPGAWYVVVVLGLVYALNIADRYVMSVLIEPIKADLHLTDSQIGFLTGVSLALFYVTVGIPIATLADRTNRTRLIALALGAWSLLTALCGVTRTFWQFVAVRVMVGVGEAGGTPPSASLISDHFGWRRRALALSIYSVGASIGSMIGSSAGYISDIWGWRSTFFVLGIPGILLAVVLVLTVREPPRGQLDANAAAAPGASFMTVVRYAWNTPSLLHCFAGSFLYCLWSWGLMWWTPSYLVRSQHMTLSAAGQSLAWIHGVGGTLVLLATSVIMRTLAGADVRSVPRFIAGACTLGTVPSIIAFTTHSQAVALAALWVFIPITYAVFGPPYALIQNLVPAHMRAQAMAILMMVGNVGNLIVAPQLVGFASDALNARYGSDSLRVALLPLTVVGLWSAAHWWMSGWRVKEAMRRAGNLSADETVPG
ncbi:MAG: MFS transporter [Steroidobacterales bacterium]